MSKYTPGPWKIASNGKNAATFRIWRNDPVQELEGANAGYACIAPHVHGGTNARLIAAAPELLEALRKQSLIIARAQTILADWIVPDSKISDHEALNALLGLLDGPEQREACHLMIAAIKKTEAQS